MSRIGFTTRIGRSLRLRCPRCGEGRLFRGWFAMHDRCGVCGTDFRREPGFYLGSIYFNYGLTALVVTVAYVVAQVIGEGRNPRLLWSSAAFCVLFPLWFFRYARSLWLGMDHFVDRAVEQPNERRP